MVPEMDMRWDHKEDSVMLNIFRRIIADSRGESLAETLIAMLISAMGMVVLAGALVSASKANEAAEDILPFSGKGLSNGGTVTIEYDGNSDDIPVSYTQYEDDEEDRSVYFYESN